MFCSLSGGGSCQRVEILTHIFQSCKNRKARYDVNMDDILNFTYKNSYLIYARKSTDDPDNQKNSISYQRGEGIRQVKQDRLIIAPVDLEGFCKAGIISERHTAFKEDEYFNITRDGKIEYRIERPKFAQLAYYLQEG